MLKPISNTCLNLVQTILVCALSVVHAGRKLFFQFLRIQYTLSGAPKVGYAQLRCIFRAKVGATSKVVFLVRWAEVLLQLFAVLIQYLWIHPSPEPGGMWFGGV